MISVEILGSLKFGSDAIAYTALRVRGGLRDHVHEYPHSPGGAPEKLGRKLYEISVTSTFISDVGDSTAAWGQSKWPDGLNRLMRKFEEQTTDDLYLPNIGKLKAYCLNWDRDLDVTRIRNGERVELVFREDQAEKYLAADLIQTAQNGILDKAYVLEQKSLALSPRPSIFSQIQEVVNTIQGMFDQRDMFAMLVAAKLDWLAGILRQADRDIKELGDPVNHEILEALLDLWSAAVELKDTISGAGVILTWRVPRDMSVNEASIGIYHDTDHAMDLMQLNALEDPYLVRVGTELRYLQAA